MNKFNIYIANKMAMAYDSMYVPTLWCSLKTYYEQNSINAPKWKWADPWFAEENDIDQVLELCKQNPPNVFGCSVFVWNEPYMDKVANAVKLHYPNCVIIYGGPQCDIKYNDNFFAKKPWVDIVLPSDAYGEIILTEILDHFEQKDFENVPYIYYTDKNKNKLISEKTIDKRSFNWPNNILKSQEEYLLPKFKDKQFYAIMETSRGCPYKCIYCDWGGGTYTKMVKKPYQTILDELEWLAKTGCKSLGIADANFGIMSIDVDIAEYLVELNSKHGFPKLVHIENAKNHHDRVIKIQAMFAKANMINYYKIAIQAIDETIKNNIERIDIPFEKQLEGINYLRANFKNLPIKVETIVGLPGATYETTLSEINLMLENDIPPARANNWMLLPESPAFSKELREKFKIETINTFISTEAFNLKSGFKVDNNVLYAQDFDNPDVETVVATYSYTRDDWVKMVLANALSGSGWPTSLNNYLIKYISKTHEIKPIHILDKILSKYIMGHGFKNRKLQNKFDNLVVSLTNYVNGCTKDSSIDYHDDFPLKFSPLYFITFVILTHLQEFYSEICDDLAQEFNDDKIIDLGNYISNATIDLTYDPRVGRTFTAQYDWKSYFDNGTDLVVGPYEYILTDKLIYLNAKWQEPDWYLYKDDWVNYEKQFFYKGVGDLQNSKLSNTISIK